MTPSASCEARALVVARGDNVATLLEPVAPGGAVRLLGESDATTGPCATQSIAAAHKLALAPIATGAAVRKYGHRIGYATRAIAPGEWVHLHNCASDVDERAQVLHPQTGAPEDTRDAYA